ncbi:MAG: DUF3078 domain-containing protein [Bacteroidales bacterium]|nr:DUF3078 domain-containing protein [Bacteroidales bacterium]
MRRILEYSLVILAMSFSMMAYGQDDKTKKDAQAAAAEAAQVLADTPEVVVAPPKPVYWTNTLTTTVNFAQTSFTSWAAGGNNNYTLNSIIRGDANWAKDKKYWNNHLEFDYGFLYSQDKPIIQKSVDRTFITSTWGYKVKEKLNYTANFTFLNQTTNGWVYPTPAVQADEEPTPKQWKDARVLKSGFFSPAYVTLGVGVAWVPTKWLTVNFAPLTGSTTIVGNEKLRKNYGMARKSKFEDAALYPDQKDENGVYFITGNYYKPLTFALGAQLTTNVKFNINDKFNVNSNLILFSNYLKNPQNFRVNWDNTILWKLSKLFSLNLTTNLIYDDTILVVEEDFPNGHRTVQLKEFLQFGFTYSFTNKKK